ncbi:PREDICTED: late histone H2B.L4-like [Branchiostoma belcheri]|uniref:Late histone H2B.L4-like n=1 Tax=Branchiostoma belcheri TaxID=7741 RepID=A0A6P4ZNL7_BRABE|nr:PREDICTED: late histone H2B.L4-like [Branchiostoma belcheri]
MASDRKAALGKHRCKRRRRRRETFGVHIYKVLRQLHPDISLSKKTVLIVDCFLTDILERIAEEASRLATYNRRSTINSREIQTAVKLIVPGYLAKFAAIEGTKAVQKYTSSK